MQTLVSHEFPVLPKSRPTNLKFQIQTARLVQTDAAFLPRLSACTAPRCRGFAGRSAHVAFALRRCGAKALRFAPLPLISTLLLPCVMGNSSLCRMVCRSKVTRCRLVPFQIMAYVKLRRNFSSLQGRPHYLVRNALSGSSSTLRTFLDDLGFSKKTSLGG